MLKDSMKTQFDETKQALGQDSDQHTFRITRQGI